MRDIPFLVEHTGTSHANSGQSRACIHGDDFIDMGRMDRTEVYVSECELEEEKK